MAIAKPVTFTTDHRLLRADAALANLVAELEALPPISSQSTFNQYCRTACQLWQRLFPVSRGVTSDRFQQLLNQITIGNNPDQVFSTPWGGVVITRHEPPSVEKYLVIKRGGYLALETHESKRERIEVEEGRGLLLWSEPETATLLVEELKPGSDYLFTPGMIHCIIGTEDLLIMERGSDPKGMDKDLVFIYTPE